MKFRDILVGVLIVVLVVVLANRLRSDEEPEVTSTPEPSVAGEIADLFGVEIPANAEKVTITGDGGRAVVTREGDEDNRVSFLADLPDPSEGKFYQAWVEKGDPNEESYEIKSLGKLSKHKGGYLLESGASDEFEGVVITEETLFDATPENRILEGSF